jgi:fermentation-respiration switch protein FrsA (DUF1100 family)
MKRVPILFLLLILITSCASEKFIYNVTVARKKPPSSRVSGKTYEREKLAWIYENNPEDIALTAYDGVQLRAYFIRQEPASKKFVILAHGYGSEGFGVVHFTEYYLNQGFSVLLPDARGHGRSGGDFIDYGWFSRLDYQQWINYLIRLFGDDIEIILHGVSMGGSTVLMTGGEPIPFNVKALVSDCAYTSAWDILSYLFTTRYSLYGSSIDRVMRSASDYTALQAGYSLEEASTLNQVKKSVTPTLFIHGEEDDFIPVTMAYQLFEASPVEKELLIVPGAGHGQSVFTDEDTYYNVLDNFLSRYIHQ